MVEPAKQSPEVAVASGRLDNLCYETPHWHPGFIRQFPWLELGALLVALLCEALAVVVLIQSDGKNVDDWADIIPTRPNILVVVLTTISSIALGGIIAQGVAIAWWRRALRPATIGSLQRAWDHGNDVLSCLMARNKMTILAAATLATKLIPVNSALLQRATATELRTVTRSLTVSSYLATEFPYGYQSALMTGTRAFKETPTVFTSAFSSALFAFQSLGSGAINPFVFGQKRLFTGCAEGSCEYLVDGIGFAAECSSSTQKIDYGENSTRHMQGNETNLAVALNAPIFVNTFDLRFPDPTITPSPDWPRKNYSYIRMTSQYMKSKMGKGSLTCPGNLTTKTCELRPAVIRYRLTQTSSGITLGGNASALATDTQQVDGNHLVRYLFQNTKDGWVYSLTAIGGIQLALSAILSANVTVSLNTVLQPYYLRVSGPLAPYYVSSQGQTIAPSGACTYTVQDPTDVVLRQLNTVMLLVGMQMASGNDSIPVQTDLASQTLPRQYYTTNYGFMAAGIAVALIGILGVTIPYYGFWQLGRKVTLGPFETANALQAPLLQSESRTRGDMAHLLKQAAERPLRYGLITPARGLPEQLAFAPPEYVRPLHK